MSGSKNFRNFLHMKTEVQHIDGFFRKEISLRTSEKLTTTPLLSKRVFHLMYLEAYRGDERNEK